MFASFQTLQLRYKVYPSIIRNVLTKLFRCIMDAKNIFFFLWSGCTACWFAKYISKKHWKVLHFLLFKWKRNLAAMGRLQCFKEQNNINTPFKNTLARAQSNTYTVKSVFFKNYLSSL